MTDTSKPLTTMNESILLEALKKIAEVSYIEIPAPILRLKEIKRWATEAIKKWEDSSGFTVEELKQAEERAERLYKKHTKNDYKGEDSSGKETGMTLPQSILDKLHDYAKNNNSPDVYEHVLNDMIIAAKIVWNESVPQYKEDSPGKETGENKNLIESAYIRGRNDEKKHVKEGWQIFKKDYGIEESIPPYKEQETHADISKELPKGLPESLIKEIKEEVDKEPEDAETFFDYIIAARDNFVIKIEKQEWNTELRMEAENILIAYDQMRAKLFKDTGKEDEDEKDREIKNLKEKLKQYKPREAWE